MIQGSEKRNYTAFLWHALLLSITATFLEINTVLPAMIIRIGGNELHIGIMTTIMMGVPLVAQILFAGYLHNKKKKKPFLLLGINLRIIALAAIAFTIMNISRFSLFSALILIYGELLLFTLSGAFAGVSYIDIIGKSFSGDTRRSLFLNKQIISSSGILISALIVRLVLQYLGYPDSYFILYISAAAALLLASIGFYALNEKSKISPIAPFTKNSIGRNTPKDSSFIGTIRSIPGRIRTDSNLKNYIIIANLLSAGVATIPFFISFALHRYSLDPALVGNLLLVQIAGIVLSSFLWKLLVKKRGFKGILVIQGILSSALPAAAFLTGTFLPVWAFLIIFFLSGTVLSAQRITSEAVLVEISTEEHRALYSGIIGTLNLSIVFLPVITGSVVNLIGYLPMFITASILPGTAILFIRKMNCPIDRQS